MSISVDRIRADIEAIGRITATPGSGATRPTFSPQWRAARDYVIDQARRIGCLVTPDEACNIHARMKGLSWQTPAWLSGSHLDSVPRGGDYDGVAGVIAPLEVLRAAKEDGNDPLPLELVIFAEEEGTTFGLGMIGSRLWVGSLSHTDLEKFRNADGKSWWEARVAGDADDGRRFESGHYHGLIEVHIEQGPAMWKNQIPLAIVTAIAGRKQYLVSFRGVANHAGSTSMHDRKDALAGAATLILQLEGLARGLSEQTVATVGKIECKPNAINVIPDQIHLTIDFRSSSNDVLIEGDRRIRELVEQIATRRGLEFSVEQTEDAPAVPMDTRVCAALEGAAQRLDLGTLSRTISGALHDSAILAPLVPTAMLFVASRDGISHNPVEFSRAEDIAQAASVVYEVARQ